MKKKIEDVICVVFYAAAFVIAGALIAAAM